MQSNSFEKWIGILVFSVSSLEFGCNITRVHVLSIKKIKLTTDGRILFNGMEIPVYYLGDLLKAKSISKNKNNRILIYESNEGPYGIGIDEIKEILPLDEKIFENEVKSEKGTDKNFLLGKIYFEGRTIILPDFDKIINRIKSLQNVSLEITKA
jgi:chemotaxis signal transduction protein